MYHYGGDHYYSLTLKQINIKIKTICGRHYTYYKYIIYSILYILYILYISYTEEI